MDMAKEAVSPVKVRVIEIVVCRSLDESCYQACEAGKNLMSVERSLKEAVKKAKRQALSELLLNSQPEEFYIRFTVTKTTARQMHGLPSSAE